MAAVLAVFSFAAPVRAATTLDPAGPYSRYEDQPVTVDCDAPADYVRVYGAEFGEVYASADTSDGGTFLPNAFGQQNFQEDGYIAVCIESANQSSSLNNLTEARGDAGYIGESDPFFIDDPNDVCSDSAVTTRHPATAEECDDGGTDIGDGCDDLCQEEEGWSCTGEPSMCTEDPEEPPPDEMDECEEEIDANFADGFVGGAQESLCRVATGARGFFFDNAPGIILSGVAILLVLGFIGWLVRRVHASRRI